MAAGMRLTVTHGNGFAADAYLPFWQLLAPKYDVLVFDFRNHGQSPPVTPANHNYAQFSRDLEVILQAIDTLPDMLRALRFEPGWVQDDGTIEGVGLIDEPRNKGDELHFWNTLAPFVEPGSYVDWFGEDGAVWRWRFDGNSLRVVGGSLSFDE